MHHISAMGFWDDWMIERMLERKAQHERGEPIRREPPNYGRSSAMGTITMDVRERDEMVQALQTAHGEAAALRDQLTRTLDENQFWDAALAASEIVKFSMAHLSPEAVDGWPRQALVVFADFVLATPGASSDLKSWAGDALAFSKEADVWDGKRARAKDRVATAIVPVDVSKPRSWWRRIFRRR